MESKMREDEARPEDPSEWLVADEPCDGELSEAIERARQEGVEVDEDPRIWHCVQTKPKSEHIARASLLQFGDVEVYCPRIRYQKTTRRGKVWFTEALFPGYLFARFEPESRLRAVAHANAVSRLLQFGGDYATLRPEVIAQIRHEMSGEELWTIENHDSVSVGEETEVANGPLRGLKGIVTALLSGGDRVRILMEMFGDLKEVEVPVDALIATRGAKETLSESGLS